MNRPTVLILASDPAFSREITANWPQDPAPHSHGPEFAPEFVVLDEGLSRDLKGNHYDLAIADASSVDENSNGKKDKNDRNDESDKSKALKQSLAAAGKPAIVVLSEAHSDPALDFYKLDGAVLELRREPGLWPAIVGLIGREILRRRQAESRAREAEAICTAAQAEAMLGRYMLEMRPSINNALTSVLGNAELVLLSAESFSGEVRDQLETIRSTALRLHEIMQRFWSLEAEMKAVERNWPEAEKAPRAVGTSGRR